MKKVKRIVALLLCTMLAWPAQTASASAFAPEETIIREEFFEDEMETPQRESEQIQERELEVEPEIPDSQEESTERNPSLQMSVSEEETEQGGELIIYWNPGGDGKAVKERSSTPSAGTISNISSGETGSDHANGLTPETAVLSLNTAVRKAERLSRRMGVDLSEITICAMSPMIIPTGTLYTVRGKGVSISPWDRREDSSDLIFAVDGGQLTLNNINLRASDGAISPEDIELVYVKSGTVQLGSSVEMLGTIALDYTTAAVDWELASSSQLIASRSEVDQEHLPRVELTNKFEPVSDYLLDLQVPHQLETVTAVKALYSDSKSTEEFIEAFSVLERDSQWELAVEERIGGVLRDTTSETDMSSASGSDAVPAEMQTMFETITKSEDMELTQKSLIASRNSRNDALYVYWNPGEGVETSEGFAQAGNDSWADGNSLEAPVKSWYKARTLAAQRNKPIKCVQTLSLSDPNIAEYMKFNEAGDYLDGQGNFVMNNDLGGGAYANNLTVVPLDHNPILQIPDDTSIVFERVTFRGLSGNLLYSGSQLLLAEGGELIFERNVKLESGYLRVNLSRSNKAIDNPIVINDESVEFNVHFLGIESNVQWRYLDVIIAGDRLVAQKGSEDAAGQHILTKVSLELVNTKTIDNGGLSLYEWSLRQDTIEDDSSSFPGRIELYATYYFDAIYVDGEQGDDRNYGSDCMYPLASFPQAKAVLEQEMAKSLAVRQAKYDEDPNSDWQQYAIPDVIYICGTISVTDSTGWDQPWELDNYTNPDGSKIIVEIRAHLEDDTEHHSTPDILVHVKGSAAKLKLGKGILIRNEIDKNTTETYSVIVDEGARLRLEADAQLTGLKDSSDQDSRTLGTHIMAGKNAADLESEGTIELAADWSGSIDSKQYGIRAYGTNSLINMKAGTIRNHLNKRSTENSNDYQAGVYIKDATFHMSGGSISENTSNLGGAGVYIDDGATFDMVSGSITDNQALTFTPTGVIDINLMAYGVGVYASAGSTFNMGKTGGVNQDTVIGNNTVSNRFAGIGLYIASGAKANIFSGTVKGNRGHGGRASLKGISYGAGISNYGDLVMEGGLITENGSAFMSAYADIRGAGIFTGGTSQSLTDVVISLNECGTATSVSSTSIYTGGGGLFTSHTIDLTRVRIEKNRAFFGGGMAAMLSNTSQQVNMNQVIVENNIATRTSIESDPDLQTGEGYGGGIYTSSSKLLADGLTATENYAQSGAGLWLSGNSNYPTRILNGTIQNNTAGHQGGGIHTNTYLYIDRSVVEGNLADYGGGIFNARADATNGTSMVYARDLRVINNKANEDGGGIYNGYTIHVSESAPGDQYAVIAGNTARRGGGVFNSSLNYATGTTKTMAIFDITEPMKNKVVGEGAQGNNIFINQIRSTSTDLYLLKGRLDQPDGSVPGIYNIYMASEGNGAGALWLDPVRLEFGGVDTIYLENTNNYLRYLADPPAEKAGELYLGLNSEYFTTGSIVVKPANVTSVLVTYPFWDAGSVSRNYIVSYSPKNQDAATANGIGYIRDNNLPDRTSLGGYRDPSEASLTNIILIGEGVYIGGASANDINTGLTPSSPVKTFAKAREILERKTTAANNGTSDKPVENIKGFAPFIYICGTVAVDSSQTWELDYTDPMYLDDSKYREYELNQGREPELAQVKRFTSFLTAQLIDVRGAGTELKIPALIINGMSDSVITADQGAASPIFEIEDARLWLGDRASLRNNYRNMIVGKKAGIIIESNTEDSASFTNRQLEVVRGDGIELSDQSELVMKGYASIVFPNVPEGMASPNSYLNANAAGRGAILNSGSSITMEEYSKIIFTDDQILPSASNIIGIVSGNNVVGAGTASVILKDDASIQNCYAGIATSYYDVDIRLQGRSKLIDNFYGIYSYQYAVNGISVLMTDDAEICADNSSGEKIGAYGVSLSGPSAVSNHYNENNIIKVEMAERSSIHGISDRGIQLSQLGSAVEIKMTGHSKIYNLERAGGSTTIMGIYVNSVYNAVTISMEDDSSVSHHSGISTAGYGVAVSNVFTTHGNAPVVFNMSGNSVVKDCYSYALYIFGCAGGATVNLADAAGLNCGANTVYFASNSSDITVNMEDDSYISGARTYNINILPNATTRKYTLNMSGNSWIGVNETSTASIGIYIYTATGGIVSTSDDMLEINMSGHAMIGGNGSYGSSNPRRGHSTYGIHSYFPVKINMTDESKITHNTSGGIMLNLHSGRDHGGYNTIVEMSGKSKIANSSYGIRSSSKLLSDGNYSIEETITLSEHARIEQVSYGSDFVSANTKVYLKDEAYLAEKTSTSNSYHTLMITGQLYMDGTVTVEGLIYLRDSNNPITLMNPVPAGDPLEKYKLYLVEGFIGQVVVKPAEDDERETTHVADASEYIDYFEKALAVGMANDKDMVKDAPNIVLEGENNVYISNNGHDINNNGTSRGTPIRTFKRAKELLETGLFKEGANIIVCSASATGSPVVVQAGDEEWSFDDGGYITNGRTGHTWQPKVIRHESYYGNLIHVNSDVLGAASYVNFKNITIDGGSFTNVTYRNYSKELLRITNGSVTLGENTVLENNVLNLNAGSNYISDTTSSVLGVYVLNKGNLVIDGATLRDLNTMNLRNNYSDASYRMEQLAPVILNDGKVEIKDGTIENNTLGIVNSGSSYLDFPQYHGMILNRGTAAAPASFTMRGGQIRNNQIMLGSFPNIHGGAVTFVDGAEGTISGGTITNNTGGKGAAVYYGSSGKLIISDGRIRNNSTAYMQAEINEYSAIYIDQEKFQLKGGSAELGDNIYLSNSKNLITVSANIYHSSRKYKIYLNQGVLAGQFTKGSVVIQPDGVQVQSVSSYLLTFDVVGFPYILDAGQSTSRQGGTVMGISEADCLLLMQAVFLDSSKPDGNDGNSPATAVRTFEQAKAVGRGNDPTAVNRDYFIIYISGLAEPEAGEIWSLEDVSYMCRYTGFQVYQADGTAAATQRPYSLHLIRPKGDFTLENVKIYGRRNQDGIERNGEAIIRIPAEFNVTMNSGTLLSRNYNDGGYIGENGLPVNLTARGGAVKVDIKGRFTVNGGTISNCHAIEGAAIYLDADTEDSTGDFGQVMLDQQPVISGDIYLNGAVGQAHAYVIVTENYVPGTSDNKVNLRLPDDYDGRQLVLYTDDKVADSEQIDYFQLESYISAVYDFTYEPGNPSMLVLRIRKIFYLNGQDGNDLASGLSPAEAFGSLKGLYTKVKDQGITEGAVVFIVDTIDIDEDIKLVNESYVKDGMLYYGGAYLTASDDIQIESQLSFKRYSKPTSTTQSGFDVSTNVNTLFNVESGKRLELHGIAVDGHSMKGVSSLDFLTADAVVAEGPLVCVNPGAELVAEFSKPNDVPGDAKIGKENTTRFVNNTNKKEKIRSLGINDLGFPVTEGSSAGIEILSDDSGTACVELQKVEFSNLALGNSVVGGSDIYQNGILRIHNQVLFSGSVFLEGLGSSANPERSRWLDVLAYGIPVRNNFHLSMRDPYNTRVVVVFPGGDGGGLVGPSETQIGRFLLDDEVNLHYALFKRPAPNMNVLELQIPMAVYIDGQNGNDGNEGWTPEAPVKTLQQAYRRLSTVGGKVIYVVDTVEIQEDMGLSGNLYKDYGQDGESINLSATTDHVDIRRYARPDAWESLTGYNVGTHTGTLLRVTNEANLTLGHSIYVDGHYSPKDDPIYTSEFFVSDNINASAPLIEVDEGASLNLFEESYLYDNNNAAAGLGGAIYNGGTVELDGGRIHGNYADKGAGIYQEGTFRILSNADGISTQEIYLATENSGTPEDPVWGEDYIIQTAVWMESETLMVQMDNAVAGRPVSRYLIDDVEADAQHDRYQLGNTVPLSLFLVEDEDDPAMLELQDWRILRVAVPTEIFLAIQQSRNGAVSAKRADSSGLTLGSPEYAVVNEGRYDVKVSLSGFVNKSGEAGITDFDEMNLVDALTADSSRKDFYLAIEGIDQTDGFSGLTETSLDSYYQNGRIVTEMGQLAPNEQGQFKFIGDANENFVNYYQDPMFPFFGAAITADDRIAHLRHKDEDTGETSPNYARANYQMIYRVEIVPPRR